jgi:hypothetical protein
MADYALFVPECWVDTALMRALLRGRDEFISHHQGIGKVGGVLRRQGAEPLNTRRVVGMVDGDQKFDEQPYLTQFTRVLVGGWDRKLHPHCVLQHPDKPTHYLIVLHPACDGWLFRTAQQADIDLAALGLPTEFEAFLEVTKPQGALTNKPLEMLLREIQRLRQAAYRELADFVASVMDLTPPRHQ